MKILQLKSIPVLLGLLVGGGFFVFYFSQHTSTPPEAVIVASAPAPSGTSLSPDDIATSLQPASDAVEYRNDQYHFSFFHSSQATVQSYDEGGGAATITLQNLEKVRGFQVFITPYTEPAISDARFKEDVPSGVRTNVEDTTLDGVRAVTFNSHDAVLGDTREIWFIYKGYLYEITTLAGVANWFTPIIGTWRFLD